MTLLNEFSDLNQKNAIVNHINQRWGQLCGLETKWSDDALNKLFLTNSGGAVAVLSFIGALGVDKINCWVKISLAFFTFGLLLVILNSALLYHLMDRLFTSYRADANAFLSNNLDWEILNQNDNTRSLTPIYLIIIGWASFIFLILGVIFGGVALFI